MAPWGLRGAPEQEMEMRVTGKMQVEAVKPFPAIFHLRFVPVVGQAKQRQLSLVALACNPCTLVAEARRLS